MPVNKRYSDDIVIPDADNTTTDDEDEDQLIQDSGDEGQSDVGTDDALTDCDDDTTNDDNVSSGSIVWGKVGRIWYPGVVVTQEEVPPETLAKLGRNLVGKVLVRWMGEGNYSALRDNCVELLARNKIDEYRANRSNYISKMYHLAVSELIDD